MPSSPTSFPDIILIRHGQTEWNREGRIQGQGNSVLTDLGQAQARAYGALLADRMAPLDGHALYRSPAGRCAQTTELAEDRVAVILKAMSITDPSELMKLQADLIAAEQKKAQAMVKEATTLYQGVAKDLFAPIQTQMTKAFEQASKFKAV